MRPSYKQLDKPQFVGDIRMIVREGKPKKLLSFFKEKGYNVSEYEKGIYHVLKKDHVDVQVVVTKEVGDDYLWLKALSDKLTFEEAIRLVQAAITS